MKRVENQDDRLITFSKRKSGIYKKASELATLTGAEIAFVVFSPAGKPFSFAHPSLESVTNRFLGDDPQNNDITHPLVEAHKRIIINELTVMRNKMANQLDIEKTKGQKLKNKVEENKSMGWWDTPIEDLNYQELIQLENKFRELYMSLCSKVMEINNGVSSSSSSQDLETNNMFS
ncbi:unnamed protein product [Dovyalis caffra]|uniref:MADS-box domain-containing protein n=1 Tax=Dovyalis caffra TaxID=77055 RepID=A0AAV1R521_9ROSI|nr:unnamed protein product [Dovyalis caffra]